MTRNPLENYKQFRIYNYKNLMKEWNKYWKKGIQTLKQYLETLLPTFNGEKVKYRTYREGAFLPMFIITIPKDTPYQTIENLWYKLYYMLEEFSIKNSIYPVFDNVNFRFNY